MARTTNEQKVYNYHKPWNFNNIGLIIFGVMLIYIIISIVAYFRTTHMSGYEVKVGSLTENNVYRGMVCREERVVEIDQAGYIYYFVSEGTHLACGNMVYTLDSSGSLAETLQASASGNTVSDESYANVRSDIISYKRNFSAANYETVYDFKQTLGNEISNLSNDVMLASLDQLDASSYGLVKGYAPQAGNVAFYIDGYESITPEEITSELLSEETYQKNALSSNTLVGQGDQIYKLVTSEDWDIVISVDNDRAAELEEAGYVRVKFLKDQFQANAKVTLLGPTEDNLGRFCKLTFTTSMMNYISDRFLDIELVLEEMEGLKVPNSAIVNKNFFLVPETYFIKGAGGADSLIRQTYTEDNQLTSEVVAATIYYAEDGMNYVDANVLNAGDVLILPDSQETYTVSKQASLIGVYNINKGYADFRQITILYENEEYSIVQSNTMYGLNAYDYIALDADTVEDDQLVTDRKVSS
ncbi:MAG: hypothetical protein K6G23_04160 [Lachnospiraceae bacterium]|nr:hypothetical protein [Lachnospiraceae bacterium]